MCPGATVSRRGSRKAPEGGGGSWGKGLRGKEHTGSLGSVWEGGEVAQGQLEGCAGIWLIKNKF